MNAKKFNEHILSVTTRLLKAREMGPTALQNTITEFCTGANGTVFAPLPLCTIMGNMFIREVASQVHHTSDFNIYVRGICEIFVAEKQDKRRCGEFPIIDPAIPYHGDRIFCSIPQRFPTNEARMKYTWLEGNYAEDRWAFLEWLHNRVKGE